MKNIIKKIDYLYKLAAEIDKSSANLSNLFREALATGDKDIYLVFLDLLEEEKPFIRKTLIGAILSITLDKLSRLFPDQIEGKHDVFSFKNSIFLDFKEIAFYWNGSIKHIAYENFKWWSSDGLIIFNSPIYIDETLVGAISLGDEVDNTNLYIRLHSPIDDLGVYQNSETPMAKNTYYKFINKVKQDVKKLEDLILVKAK